VTLSKRSRRTPADLERFHQAIDRAAAGRPAPVLSDPDLQELLGIASRLHQELPRDLPDPAFREALKARLIDSTSGVTSLPARRSSWFARPSNLAAASAIAAVMIALVAVGSLALLGGDDGGADPTAVAVARTETQTMMLTTMAVATIPSTEPVPTGTGGALETPPDVTPQPTPQPALTPTHVAVATTEPTTTPIATAAMTPTAAATEAPPNPTQEVTATSTPDVQLASLPPVNSTSVEAGPVPAAGDGAGGAATTVTYVLATTFPEIGGTAPVYFLAPPNEDAATFAASVGEALGIGTDVVVDEINGKQDFHVGTDTGASFHWFPEGGGFSYSGPADVPVAVMTTSEIVAASRKWLEQIDYPVDLLSESVEAQQLSDTEWLVEIALDEVPQPGYGHPLGVRMIVATDGTVTSATGYWLVPERQEDVPLIDPAEAWDALTSGYGFWFGSGGAFAEGGEMRCESIEMSYILTSSLEGMILQPVIALRGEFMHLDGLSSSGVTVFIQAARPPEGFNGP
jgi:hypothetical protein